MDMMFDSFTQLEVEEHMLIEFPFLSHIFTPTNLVQFNDYAQLQHPMTIHVYHPYRQPDGENHCQAVNGHCSHLCLPAPHINEQSPRISCACPTGLKLMDDGLMCVEDGKCSCHFLWFCPSIPFLFVSLSFQSPFHSTFILFFFVASLTDECDSIGCEN
jgi:hypothetical protein